MPRHSPLRSPSSYTLPTSTAALQRNPSCAAAPSPAPTATLPPLPPLSSPLWLHSRPACPHMHAIVSSILHVLPPAALARQCRTAAGAQGNTPLHWATYCGSSHAAKFLVIMVLTSRPEPMFVRAQPLSLQCCVPRPLLPPHKRHVGHVWRHQFVMCAFLRHKSAHLSLAGRPFLLPPMAGTGQKSSISMVVCERYTVVLQLTHLAYILSSVEVKPPTHHGHPAKRHNSPYMYKPPQPSTFHPRTSDSTLMPLSSQLCRARTSP